MSVSHYTYSRRSLLALATSGCVCDRGLIIDNPIQATIIVEEVLQRAALNRRLGERSGHEDMDAL